MVAAWVRGSVGLALVACGGKDADSGAGGPTDGPPSACGEVSEGYDVELTGLVLLQGVPVEGASVALVERNWTPGTTYGSASSGGDGRFVLQATNLVSVEGCWGTALDYKLRGEHAGFVREQDVNSSLLAAIVDGSLDADLSGVPLELDASFIPPVDTGL
jgi:hypothetical protein